ncbi:MAG: hypothetical protein KatS3mg077_2045 [Candidatus Binatia bacterium]|nr:MAG: hypothetical protein KatS3mg077_2045 [Candidatus Binatia bacterium]
MIIPRNARLAQRFSFSLWLVRWRRTSVVLLAASLFVWLYPARARAGICDPSGPETSSAAAPAAPKQYHYVFVVDTSRSMIGEGDGKGRVIFPRVKEEIRRFLERVPAGSKVTFQPFDRGPGPRVSFMLPGDDNQLQAYLDTLQAKGRDTYLYASLLEVLRSLPQDPETATIVFLFTDGKDNDPGPLTMDDVTRAYKVRRGPYDWVYYFLLGLDVPEDVARATLGEEGWQVLSVPPNQVPQLLRVQATPNQLHLGNLLQEPVARRDLQLAVEPERAVDLKLRVVAPQLAAHGAALVVEPAKLSGGGAQSLNFRLLNPQQLPHGEYEAFVCVEAAEKSTALQPYPVPLKLAYHPPGEYRLAPLQDVAFLTLEKGGTATVAYRVEANPWANAPVSVSLPEQLPQGLELQLNGGTGPVSLMPGDQLQVSLTNQGLRATDALHLALPVTLPPGTTGAASLGLPGIVAPLSWWDWFWSWWWLWLLLLLALLWLLLRWWQARQPWATCIFTDLPDCKDFPGALRGKGRVDLGKVVGHPLLNGIKVAWKGHGLPKVDSVPPGTELWTDDLPLEKSRSIEWDSEVVVKRFDQTVGKFSLRRASSGRKARG